MEALTVAEESILQSYLVVEAELETGVDGTCRQHCVRLVLVVQQFPEISDSCCTIKFQQMNICY